MTTPRLEKRVRRAPSATTDLELIATARDGAEAWRCALELTIDALVLDDSMPIVDGLGVLARLRGEAPDVRIVIHVENPANCIDAAELSAAGCVTKGWRLEALLSRPPRSPPRRCRGARRTIVPASIPPDQRADSAGDQDQIGLRGHVDAAQRAELERQEGRTMRPTLSCLKRIGPPDSIAIAQAIAAMIG